MGRLVVQYGCQGPLPTLRVLEAPNMPGGKRDVENRAGGLVGNLL